MTSADKPGSSTAQLRRFLVLEDILIGHPDGIDGPRLAAGLTWARHGSTTGDRKSLVSLFASRWQAAQDEGEWDGDAIAEGEKDLDEVTAAALAADPVAEAPAVAVGVMLRHHDGRTGTFVCNEDDGRYRVQSLKGKGFWVFHPNDCQHVGLDADPTALRAAIADITAERQRQIESEGRSADHDDQNTAAELAKAAAAYVTSASGFTAAAAYMWPTSWSASWWKPTTPRRDLVKAGALIVAEIERLDRATQKGARAA